LFVQAVSRQLVSDVDVGAYLSGGMDSGSVTAIAAKQLPYINSFTCGFDLNSASGVELGFDERPTAEYMSYVFKTEHYEMVLKAGDMERAMPSLVWHIEEPRVGQSYPNYYAAKLASKFVKVVLVRCWW
jgi:asparagine synthase (glutamine-hydrolysing)